MKAILFVSLLLCACQQAPVATAEAAPANCGWCPCGTTLKNSMEAAPGMWDVDPPVLRTQYCVRETPDGKILRDGPWRQPDTNVAPFTGQYKMGRPVGWWHVLGSDKYLGAP
jgi:hypothetical protein